MAWNDVLVLVEYRYLYLYSYLGHIYSSQAYRYLFYFLLSHCFNLLLIPNIMDLILIRIFNFLEFSSIVPDKNKSMLNTFYGLSVQLGIMFEKSDQFFIYT